MKKRKRTENLPSNRMLWDLGEVQILETPGLLTWGQKSRVGEDDFEEVAPILVFITCDIFEVVLYVSGCSCPQVRDLNFLLRCATQASLWAER